MIEFFKIILYQPLLNLLIVFYNLVPGHDLGVAIILLTVLIKLILFPFSRQAIKAQKSLKDLQPKLEEIKKKYAGQQEKQAQAMMSLYKENKINPFSSCLPLVIQLPILIAVFQVFRVGLEGSALPVYSFIYNPGTLKLISFGFLNLAKPNVILAVITAILQYFQTKFLSAQQPNKNIIRKGEGKDEETLALINKQMKFTMPILTGVVGLTLPSGLMIYWLVNILLTIFEQKIIFGKSKQKSEIPLLTEKISKK